MEVEQWVALFQRLGIQYWGVNVGYPMRYEGQSLRLYFNRNREHRMLYFAASPNDRHEYPQKLWEHIDPRLVKDRDLFPVIPKRNMEREAFTDLLRKKGLTTL